jgi:hypothetical protein
MNRRHKVLIGIVTSGVIALSATAIFFFSSCDSEGNTTQAQIISADYNSRAAKPRKPRKLTKPGKPIKQRIDFGK